MSNVQGRKRMAFKKTVLAIGLLLQCLAYANNSVAGAELPTASVVKYHSETGYYTFKLGTYEITVISDGTVPQDLHVLLKGASQQTVDGLLNKVHLHNPVEASINVFLINTGKKLILVDTGAGDFFGKGFGGKFSERLNKLGVKPEDISDILITHIHTDHTGGLVHAGKAVFPNANIYVGKADVDFFRDANNQNGVNGYDKAYFQQAQTAMQPYVALGHVKPLSGAQKILADFNAYPTPGHTPGHTAYFHPGLPGPHGPQRVLIAGDALGHSGGGKLRLPMRIYTEDMDAAVKAIGRLASLAPDIVCFGHGPVLRNAAEPLRRFADSLTSPGWMKGVLS